MDEVRNLILIVIVVLFAALASQRFMVTIIVGVGVLVVTAGGWFSAPLGTLGLAWTCT